MSGVSSAPMGSSSPILPVSTRRSMVAAVNVLPTLAMRKGRSGSLSGPDVDAHSMPTPRETTAACTVASGAGSWARASSITACSSARRGVEDAGVLPAAASVGSGAGAITVVSGAVVEVSGSVVEVVMSVLPGRSRDEPSSSVPHAVSDTRPTSAATATRRRDSTRGGRTFIGMHTSVGPDRGPGIRPGVDRGPLRG